MSVTFEYLQSVSGDTEHAEGFFLGFPKTIGQTFREPAKRHVAVDSLGLILFMMITPASVQDRDAAQPLIQTLVSLYGRLQIIWADGGYLGALVDWVKQLRPCGKLRLEIVRRCDAVRGFKVLPKRWIVERTFGWLFKSRRLCRDYEIRLDHSEAMVRICMIRLMVPCFGKTTGLSLLISAHSRPCPERAMPATSHNVRK